VRNLSVPPGKITHFCKQEHIGEPKIPQPTILPTFSFAIMLTSQKYKANFFAFMMFLDRMNYSPTIPLDNNITFS
jgi:hypothetical protein